MNRDGKNKFYRTLNLNKNTREILKWYKKIFDVMVVEDEETNTGKVRKNIKKEGKNE